MNVRALVILGTLVTMACSGEERTGVDGLAAPLESEDDSDQRAIAAMFAPHVRLHPGDPYRPANVDWYLARVSMRYHHPRCPDHEVLALGAVNQATLVAQKHPDNGSLCRHDGGDERRSDGAEGFFLEVADENTYLGAPKDEWTTYVDWRQRPDGLVEIRYWLFYAFNDNVAFIDHESDWEQVRVTLDLRTPATPKLTEISLSQHHGGQTLAPDSNDLILEEGTHPVVYAAKGSHANYPKPGTYEIKGTAGIAKDVAESNSDVWRTENRFIVLGTRAAPKNGQVFVRYWGHWGQLGDLPETDGILRHFP